MKWVGRFLQLKEDLYVVSDTHFGHQGMIRFCRQYYIPEGKDRAEQAAAMNSDIIKQWNEVIKPTDKVIHLGDVALGLSKERLKTIIGLCMGTKMLIPGNHDRGKIVNPDSRHYFNDVGFSNVEVGVNQIEIADGDNKFILSHEPLETIPEGFINIHGHVHSGIAEELYRMDDRRINVCWDAIKKEIK